MRLCKTTKYCINILRDPVKILRRDVFKGRTATGNAGIFYAQTSPMRSEEGSSVVGSGSISLSAGVPKNYERILTNFWRLYPQLSHWEIRILEAYVGSVKEPAVWVVATDCTWIDALVHRRLRISLFLPFQFWFVALLVPPVNNKWTKMKNTHTRISPGDARIPNISNQAIQSFTNNPYSGWNTLV